MKAWEKNIRKVIPYIPGEQPREENIIKLNTNENPYPPSRRILEEVKNVDIDQFRLYPDPTAKQLVEEIAKFYGLENNQVFVGVGSDDVLAMSFLTFFHSEKPILFPNITYSFYDVWANLFQIPFERPKLDCNFRITASDYYKENGGIVLANPNAPTSLYEDLDFIEDILLHNQDVIVIIDEAYIDFGGESACKLLSKYENLLVVQTFSKSRSMAGMRIGYALGNPVLIKALQEIKYSYNSYTMSQTAISYGAEVIKDRAYFEQTTKQIIQTREQLKVQLKDLGFEFPDSKTNFLFLTHNKIKAVDLFEALKKEHIYVRHFNVTGIENYLRVTIGTKEQMEIFVSFVESYLKSQRN